VLLLIANNGGISRDPNQIPEEVIRQLVRAKVLVRVRTVRRETIQRYVLSPIYRGTFDAALQGIERISD
jgi:hypothetical protein